MRRCFVRFNRPESFVHTRSSAGFTIITSGFEFSVHTGERGSLVVYADKIIRTATDAATGEEVECAIPFMKGYTVFNVEQIDGLPEHYYAKAAPRVDTVRRMEQAESFFAKTAATIRHGGTMAYY